MKKNNRIGVNENWNNDDRYDRSIRNRGHWDVFPTAAGYRPTKTGDDKSDEREMFEVERRVSTATTSQLIHILFDGDGHLANANYPIHGVKAKVREEELAAKELRRRAESGDEVAMGYFSRIFPKVRDGVKAYGDDPRVERANRVLGRLGVRESVCRFPSVRQMIVESALRELNEEHDMMPAVLPDGFDDPAPAGAFRIKSVRRMGHNPIADVERKRRTSTSGRGTIGECEECGREGVVRSTYDWAKKMGKEFGFAEDDYEGLNHDNRLCSRCGRRAVEDDFGFEF